MDRSQGWRWGPKMATAFLLLLRIFVRPALGVVDSAPSCLLSQLDCQLLSSLVLDGKITFSNTETEEAAHDFGKVFSLRPGAVLYPSSTKDIVSLVQAVYSSSSSNLSIAARGQGHAVNGQSQVENGVIVEMSSFKGTNVDLTGMYVEASGGELWIDIVKACLAVGYSPRSFTDYLHLSVGGTLSNAGVSGQAFRWGPQINNILQLEVVTGKGEVVTCSRQTQSDLFYAVLGGLGQFGIITRARVIIQPAASNVHWIRALYSDFPTFQRDQLRLISPNSEYDYVEGFAVTNTDSYDSGYNSVPFDGQSVNLTLFSNTNGSLLYYIEVAVDSKTAASPEKKVREDFATNAQIFMKDSTYLSFLERVYTTEQLLRSKGLWDVPHPWMNLLVPESKLADFERIILRSLDASTINGPLIVYPFDGSKWDSRMSAVTPDEAVFYLVAFLHSAMPSGPSLQTLLDRNSNIWEQCHVLGCKKYLPSYSRLPEWQSHFGVKWKDFVANKIKFDPKAILSPNLGIFVRGQNIPVPDRPKRSLSF